jgi:2-isopropylmalate synthase
MTKMPAHKYRPYPPVDLPDRKWPSGTIGHAPRWCSVDLRDGNQALIVPMGLKEKKEMFDLLVEIGFKEIEAGFPSASQTEYDFLRQLIEKELIPADVTVQVLTQSRQHLIRRTFESLRDVKQAIVHLYNSTSELQRRVVFRMKKNEILELAVRGAELIRNEAEKMTGSRIVYEYSPESFTGTEPDYAIEICEAVMDVWEPSRERKIILNLPSTVEMATPNVYADRIEWFGRHIKSRENVIISAHAHNDRGTAVAASELALMAGAERIEGTLFGNGERTGNVDIVTLALNMFSQGVDPELDMHDITRILETYERCTGIDVHMRHPYAGELVYTAFSGSHQDAINKGMKVYLEQKPKYWEVPYLPIDPADVGRTYESVIRINSQSGKGGVAYIMEKEFGFRLPADMRPEFGEIIKSLSDSTGREITTGMIWEAFEREYLLAASPLSFDSCEKRKDLPQAETCGSPETVVSAVVDIGGEKRGIAGKGNGPIDAFSRAIGAEIDIDFKLISYYEHALDKGSDSRAVAYIQIEDEKSRRFWGAGIDTNIETASFRAILSALNRSQRKEREEL